MPRWRGRRKGLIRKDCAGLPIDSATLAWHDSLMTTTENATKATEEVGTVIVNKVQRKAFRDSQAVYYWTQAGILRTATPRQAYTFQPNQ